MPKFFGVEPVGRQDRVEQFPQAIEFQPIEGGAGKRGGGRRYYRPEDVALLQNIRRLLYAEGYTIKGVQRILKDQGVKYVQTIGASGTIEPLPAAVLRAEPSKPALEPREAAEKSAEDDAASSGVAALGPLFAVDHTAALRKPAQRPAFDGPKGHDTERDDPLSSSTMAKMLPSAWQGTTATSPIIARLDSALTELEECARLLALARNGVAD